MADRPMTEAEIQEMWKKVYKAERDKLEARAKELWAVVAKLKDAAEPFHRLDLDLGDSPVRPDEWAEVCEPLREALVDAGAVLAGRPRKLHFAAGCAPGGNPEGEENA